MEQIISSQALQSGLDLINTSTPAVKETVVVSWFLELKDDNFDHHHMIFLDLSTSNQVFVS